jgi:hypothetical protein
MQTRTTTDIRAKRGRGRHLPGLAQVDDAGGQAFIGNVSPVKGKAQRSSGIDRLILVRQGRELALKRFLSLD